eukprot:473062_1
MDLPPSIRSRFTELCVDDINDPTGIRTIVNEFLSRANMHGPEPTERKSEVRGIDRVANTYVEMRALPRKDLATGDGGRPIYRIRSLVHVLDFCVTSVQIYTFQRALYECMALHFLSSLDGPSRSVVAPAIRAAAFGSDSAPMSTKRLARSLAVSGRAPAKEHEYVKVTGLWVRCGELVREMPADYNYSRRRCRCPRKRMPSSIHLTMRCNKHSKNCSD